MELIFDFGNARGKWFYPKGKTHGDFEHAVAVLKESDWNAIVGRGNPPDGILRVNGTPYAIGRAARKYVIADRPKGAARYRKEYYGVGLAYALCEAKGRDSSVRLFASHAPQDIRYAANLIHAAKGPMEVDCQFGHLIFDVTQVSTFDEPLGGYAHYTFNADGSSKKANPLSDKTVLVIDVGGYTADVVAVDPGGDIDLLSLKSTRTGTIQALGSFEADLRANNATLFQDSGDLDVRRVEDAIRTKTYKFGNQAINCKREADAAINELVNDVIQIIRGAGGEANYDAILMTGGGSALIVDSLKRAMPRIDFIMAEDVRELMKFANVFGGAKISALLRRMELA